MCYNLNYNGGPVNINEHWTNKIVEEISYRVDVLNGFKKKRIGYHHDSLFFTIKFMQKNICIIVVLLLPFRPLFSSTFQEHSSLKDIQVLVLECQDEVLHLLQP